MPIQPCLSIVTSISLDFAGSSGCFENKSYTLCLSQASVYSIYLMFDLGSNSITSEALDSVVILATGFQSFSVVHIKKGGPFPICG